MGESALVAAWQHADPKIARDAKAFWKRLGVLPPAISLDQRASELCAAAYLDGELVGVSTVSIGDLSSLPGCRFGFFRCLVAPEHRRAHLATSLTVFSRDVLSTWSKQHPEEGVLGMAAIIESPYLAELSRIPVWPASGLRLIGYTNNGQQIRVVWFEHARLE